MRKVLKLRDETGGSGESPVQEIVKVYDSYEVVYNDSRGRRKCRGATVEKAKAKGKRIAKRLSLEGVDAVELPMKDRSAYIEASNILLPHNLNVLSAAQLVADLLTRLEGASLQQAVDSYLANGRKVVVGATMTQAYEAYLEDVKVRGVGIYHTRDIKKFVGAFATAFAKSAPGAVTTKEIDVWLGSLGGKARNKNNARDLIITFFNFLEKKDYLPKGVEHAAKGTTPFKDPRQVITCEEDAIASMNEKEVYTPDEMRRMLAVAEPDALVTMELKGFSGIRTEELSRLWWVLVKEPDGYINITDAITKTYQRPVPILENLKRRLAQYPQAEKRNKVCKRWGSANALYHLWKRIADAAGVPYKANGFRNSYISYRLAITKDIKGVAMESGNSPEMIQRWYLDLVTPEQAQEWFTL